jgi:GNAT superfamily N-acetyltransferase
MDVSFECDDAPDRHAVQELSERLFRFNQQRSGDPEFREFAVWVRGESGEIRGGATGWSRWGWLHLDVLWVDENCRGVGAGTRLMAEVEALARLRGCKLVDLDTFSFQAPLFYRRLGYQEFADLEVGERGHRKIYLYKRLEPDGG